MEPVAAMAAIPVIVRDLHVRAVDATVLVVLSRAPGPGMAAKADGDASNATTVAIFRVFQFMGTLPSVSFAVTEA